MSILFFLQDPTYPENEDKADQFEAELRQAVKTELSDANLRAVDAGPSASIPGFIIELTLIAVGLLSIPSTIKDNLPLWSGLIKKGIALFTSKKLNFSLSPAAASILALDKVLDEFGLESTFEIQICIRTSSNLNGIMAEEIPWPPVDPDTELDRHHEAVNLFDPFYVSWLKSDRKIVSVGVDKNGEIFLFKALRWY